jgi:shikimate dehydrogenase
MIRKACVIGWPISHSRSPIIHGYWLKRYGIAGSYERMPVKPEDLSEFFARLRDNGFVGCNVTLPHKEAAFRIIRAADEATLRLAVVNTVFERDGELCGTNTDGEGFLASIAGDLPGWQAKDKTVVILGAGGATRAIVGALIDAGAKRILIANRTRARAEELRHDFGSSVEPSDWTGVSRHLEDTDLLVNTSSLGMTGQPPLNVDLDRLPKTAVVTDIVYAPLETDLLKHAKARGNPTVPGLGMLLHQAVRGFELWFGARPEVTSELYDLVARDIDPDYRR